MPLHEAFVYDALRTPRTRGKPTGGLHILTPVTLVTALLTELRKRYPGIEGKFAKSVLAFSKQFNNKGAILPESAMLSPGTPTTVPAPWVTRSSDPPLLSVKT